MPSLINIYKSIKVAELIYALGKLALTDGIFETSAYGVSIKSQNPSRFGSRWFI